MGDEADADWDAGLIEAGRTLVENDMHDRLYRSKRGRRPKLCEDCGIYPGDPRRCPGCEAYREHQC